MVLVEDQARAKIPNCSFDLPQDRKGIGGELQESSLVKYARFKFRGWF